MSILVTGGAGFIGSNLVEYLWMLGLDVRVIDDLSTGKKENIDAPILKKIKFIEGDLLDEAARKEAFKDVRVVFHLASPTSVTESMRDPEKMFKNGLLSTAHVIDEARRHNVERVIFSSSAAVYPEGDFPKKEDLPTCAVSPYSAVKGACEMLGMSLAKCYPTDFVSLRYFNVYGPKQDPESPYSGVISKLCSFALDNTPFTIYGTGEQTRDFVFVTDVATANVLAMNRSQRFGGVQINIGTGVGTSINDLLKFTIMSVGRVLIPQTAPARKGECLHSRADLTRAREMLFYEPKMRISDGVQVTLAWYKKAKAHAEKGKSSSTS